MSHSSKVEKTWVHIRTRFKRLRGSSVSRWLYDVMNLMSLYDCGLRKMRERLSAIMKGKDDQAWSQVACKDTRCHGQLKATHPERKNHKGLALLP
jgi:hypothetical protein